MMAPRFGLVELVVLAAVALAVFAVVWGVVRSRRRFGGGRACGACGYSTLGLMSFTCPECGNDLRSAGIVTAHTLAHRPSFVASAAFFTALMALVGVLLASAVAELTPELRRYEHHVGFATPVSRAYGGAHVTATATAWGETDPRFAVRIDLQTAVADPRPDADALGVEPASGSYVYTDEVGHEVTAASRFNAGVVEKWLQTRGISASDASVKVEAARIAAAAMRYARGPRVRVGAGGGGVRISSGNDPQFGSISNAETSTVERIVWLPVLAFIL